MSEHIYFGLTSQSIDLFANDTSSTVGAGLSGLLHNSAGIQAAYRIGASGTVTSFSLVAQTVGAAWVSGGFVEVDPSLMKGVYRLDLPNVVSGTEAFVTVYLSGAANMGPIVLRLDCKPLAVDVKRVASQSANASAAVTFPATIASTTNITAATGITVATNNDKTGYSLATAPPTSSAIAAEVWGSLTTTNWGSHSFGNFVLISNNSNRSVQVTGAGSGHIASDVHEMQPNVINASALATDAVTEIWAAANRTLTAFSFTPNVGGYSAGQDPATLLYVDGSTNKIKVNADNSVNATATVDVNAVATAVANILYVDGAANKLKVNADNTVNATVSGTIVNYVTIPSAVAQASILAAQITAVRGDTLTVSLPIMGSLVGRTGLVFTAKKSVSDSDAESILQVSESGGLLILNGSTSIIGTAQLSVTNATTGAVNLTLSAATTATIPLFDYLWDCQKVLSSGVSTPINGVLSVTGDVTRSTS
jgi:hypothetical protein